MLEGQNIVCFAKDWTEDPTSNNHVMRLLAEKNRVLWVNSIATRTPTLTSKRDLGKMGRKLGQFARGLARGAEQVAENLWVFTPIVLPFPHSRAAQEANRHILRQTLLHQTRKLGMADFQLWTFLPTSVSYVDGLGESVLVYYITDEFSQFSDLDTEKIVDMERRLCQKADVVFVTANSLLEAKRGYNPATHLASHGVDRNHFAAALEEGTAVHSDLSEIPAPILGFFGLIHDWIDLDLIEEVARARPQWSIVLIGNAQVDVSRFDDISNVHLLGRKQYSELPAYCKGFDVSLIPFAINELTVHVNPIKLREYLSAGTPVVSTPLPEVVAYDDVCYIADTAEAFVAACEKALAEDGPAQRVRRSDEMRKETWRAKVEELGGHVVRAMKANKRAAG